MSMAVDVYQIKWCPTKEGELIERFPELDNYYANYEQPSEQHENGLYRVFQDLDEDQVELMNELKKEGVIASIKLIKEEDEDEAND